MGSQPSVTTTAVDSCDYDEVDSRMETPQSPTTEGFEPDQTVDRGKQLAQLVIQEVALQKRIPSNQQRDIVLQALCSCVRDILRKHEILFNGMVNRIEVHHYTEFASVANELFEANANNETSQLRITWGRVVALFAFAVRLSQEYGQNQSRVNDITSFLATYVTKHVIPFVKENGGWRGLVEQFPPPEGDTQLRRAILWSGLCVGLAATMYISSLLR